MFLLYFLVFTLIFTLFKNIFLASIFLLLVGIFLSIYQWIRDKKLLSRQKIGMLFLAFVLAGGSFALKERRYYGENTPSFQLPTSNMFFADAGQKKPGQQAKQKTESIVWNGIIADIANQGKYVFVYSGEEYLLYSKKGYHIGDELWLVGNFQKNNYSSDVSYRKISPSTFAIPIFSGSFDFATWMKMKGRKGSIYETNAMLKETSTKDASSMGYIKNMKKGIQEKIIKIYGKGKVSGLLLGMLIGDRSQIPESEYQSFIDSGLVHLVAVSGGNILMIVVFLQCVLFFLPFYVRTGLILLSIIVYSLICGLDSSVFRAVIMGSLNMVALFRGREIQIWRLLSISVIIMLLVNPYFLAYDTGFLLSYSAIIGIIYFERLKNEKKEKNEKDEKTATSSVILPGKSEIKKEETAEKNILSKALQYVYTSYISPSIGASIGIFPIIIFFMGKINVLGIVVNLFVLPIVPFVMIYGFVSIRLYSWLGWAWLLWPETILINYIYKISELLSRYGLYIGVSGLRIKYFFLLMGIGLFVWRRYSPSKIEEDNFTPPPSAAPLK